MNVHKIKDFLLKNGFRGVKRLKRIRHSLNHYQVRQVFAIDKRVIIKAFSSLRFKNFEVERLLNPILQEYKVPTPKLLAFEKNKEEAYLAFEYAPGVRLDRKQLNFNDYQKMIVSMGSLMNSFHRIPIKKLKNVPFFDGPYRFHLKYARQRYDQYLECLNLLSNHRILQKRSIRAIKKFIDNCAKRIFKSEVRLNHVDMNQRNILYSCINSKCTSYIIDWETAAVQPKELDFVLLFNQVFGKGFRGRIYKKAYRGKNNLFLKAFEYGYNGKVDWDIVACHLIIWYLCYVRYYHINKRMKARNEFIVEIFRTLDFLGHHQAAHNSR